MTEPRCIHGIPISQRCPSCSAWPGVARLAASDRFRVVAVGRPLDVAPYEHAPRTPAPPRPAQYHASISPSCQAPASRIHTAGVTRRHQAAGRQLGGLGVRRSVGRVYVHQEITGGPR